MLKPHLACDWTDARIEKMIRERGYVLVQPKIDGVRGVNLHGQMSGRSLKPHGNKFVGALYSGPEYLGFDGELAAQEETHPDLCRLTTSAVNTIEGCPFTLWHLFDWLHPSVIDKPYVDRLSALDACLRGQDMNRLRVRIVPSFPAFTLEEVLSFDDQFLDAGYEGSIIRDPFGSHKSGRCTEREGAYMRIKRFIEEDAVVVGIEEGRTNNNVATTNELGLTERSTHQENMAPNGMVGSLTCQVKQDVVYRGEKLFEAGQFITVAAGRMPHDQRKYYFENQSELLGETIKFKTFPVGVKDKPRFPTYQSHRASSDIV